MLVVTSRLQIPLSELRFTYARSPGPGGQNVNKVASKAIMHWDVTHSPNVPDEVRARFLAKNKNRVTTEGELVLSSSRYRDQGRNTVDCLEKLRDMLREATIVPKVRKKTRPTKAAKEKRLESKRVKSSRKQSRGASYEAE